MSYLLDTNICVYWLKGKAAIEHKAVQIGLDKIVLSFITLSELYYGAYKSQRATENLAAIRKLADTLECIESDEDICETFGKIKAGMEKDGNIIDDADLFIAACAMSNDAVLVTNNEKHFKRIKGLKLENWLKD